MGQRVFFFLDASESHDRKSLYVFCKDAANNSVCLRVMTPCHHLYCVLRPQVEFEEAKSELRSRLGELRFKMVTKTVNFTHPRVPKGNHEVIYLQYPASKPIVRQWKSFLAVFGTKNGFVENLLVHRGIRGPCWIQVDEDELKNPQLKVTRCKNEYCIDTIERIRVSPDQPADPTIRVLPFHIDDARTVSFPSCQFDQGRLDKMVSYIHEFDPDVLVSHAQFDLLLNLVKKSRIPQWSRLLRINRKYMPKQVNYRYLWVGRLCCDTAVISRMLVKSPSYSLADLCVKQGVCVERPVEQVMGLVTKLKVLPLTLQLSRIAGNLWRRTLAAAKSERVEYLLLHTFHTQGFVVPDPKPYIKKRRTANFVGGLVIAPKPGLYKSFVLLLDFNSLYPSIIREYDLCFGPDKKILPDLLAGILEARQMARQAGNEIQQLALKLTANMVYGCLGQTRFRFADLALAELVTKKGREALQALQTLVQERFPTSQVIYGDTDSIMVEAPSSVTTVTEARALAAQIQAAANEPYSVLRLGLDGIFQPTLLLAKKKKYAATMLYPEQRRELKGLEQNRRDWCELAGVACDYVLDELILSGETATVEKVVSYLRELQERMPGLDTRQYIIRKALSRRPNEYTEANPHHHVRVALAQPEKNWRPGDIVEYVMCETARGPVSLSALETIDVRWYLEHQILPAVSRLLLDCTLKDLRAALGLVGEEPNRGFVFTCTYCEKKQAFYYRNLFCNKCGTEFDGDACRDQFQTHETSLKKLAELRFQLSSVDMDQQHIVAPLLGFVKAKIADHDLYVLDLENLFKFY